MTNIQIILSILLSLFGLGLNSCIPTRECVGFVYGNFTISVDITCEDNVPYQNVYTDADCNDFSYSSTVDTTDIEYNFVDCSGGCTEYIKYRFYHDDGWDDSECSKDQGYGDNILPYGCFGYYDVSARYTCGDDWIQTKEYYQTDCGGDPYWSAKYNDGCGTTTVTYDDSTYDSNYYLEILHCAGNYYQIKLLSIAIFIVYALFM